jgi:hypothetical protein
MMDVFFPQSMEDRRIRLIFFGKMNEYNISSNVKQYTAGYQLISINV